MSQPEGTGGGADWLELGQPPRPGMSRRLRMVVVALAAVALVMLGAAIGSRSGLPAQAPESAKTPSPSISESPPPLATEPPSPSPTAPVVTDVGHPILPELSGRELFGFGPEVAIRIEPGRGLVTRTPVPALASSGPVTFLAGPHQLIIRPWDVVAGYLVPDGHSALPLPAALGRFGAALPGPDPQHLWVQKATDVGSTMVLVGFDGRSTGVSVAVQDRGFGTFTDGVGYLLVGGISGTYEAKPSGMRRVTTGSVVAVGPRGYLVVDCDTRHRCSTSTIDRRTHKRRKVPAYVDVNQPRGAISPDGSLAAVTRRSTTGTPSLHLVDLSSGRDTLVALDVYGELSPDDGNLMGMHRSG